MPKVQFTNDYNDAKLDWPQFCELPQVIAC